MAALAVAPAVTVEEYLSSSYEPDMDLVDGVLEDRNVGEFDPAGIQRALMFALVQGEARGGYYIVQATRMQVSSTRYRVPDTCLIPADNLPHRIIRDPPLLCIEVLSRRSRNAITAPLQGLSDNGCSRGLALGPRHARSVCHAWRNDDGTSGRVAAI